MSKPRLIPSSLAELQALCCSCGLPKSGTKAVLSQRLRLAAKQFQPVLPTARILSIDLGLKNFAFSLLTPASPSPSPSSLITRPPQSADAPLAMPVHLHAWHRLDLTSPTLFTSTAKTTELDDPSPPPSPNPASEEAFSPTALAALTLHLVKNHLLPLEPTHVLIERQRYRTGGGAAVFEWTLRVNTLEAMLHAVFAALQGGCWEGRVEAVLPKAVSGFLFPDGTDVEAEGNVNGEERGEGGLRIEDGDGKGKGKGKGSGKMKGKGKNAGYLLLKKGKVDLLRSWLGEEGREGRGLVIPRTTQARDMVRLFGDVFERGKTVDKKEKQGIKIKRAMVGKLDDLSDSVLQGMVWLRWQRNLADMIKARPELLEDEK
ncbi:Cruciform cutting endonuclease 1, mitochondrial [Madurella mycetomatis]|uniref:Cruciform cutting endonuclease 1, mitochondrial n=1 Tax=Madurella mycetomatis TaxID=100816 RepID=A0A175WF24_9PEZI|nr:Cruciform cutting endonuclease 1, mitochondrial [Madurella mycetomatis]